MRLYLSGGSRALSVESAAGISARKDSILELIFNGNGSNLEALLQNPNFSTPLWLIVWDPNIMNAVANSQTAMNAVANSQTAMDAVINSQTALDAVINSQTAMNAVANSQTAMDAVINSQTAMNAVINSQTALDAVINSQTAMNAVANSQTAMDAVINSQTAMNAVINSQTALNAIRNNATAWNTFINSTINVKEVPTMTSNTTPEGVASASSIYGSSYDAFKALDKNTSTYWYAGGSAPQWIQYQFVSPVFVHTVVITGYGSAGNGYNPNSITIQASQDGSTFIDIQTFNQEFTNTATTLYIAKQGYYKYWRVRVNSTVNSSYSPRIIELNFKGFIQPT
jgi:hypothetical protein